ncbi:acyl-CoA dehydrogenase family protein [Streptomyces sp. AM 4-1-1]|uniref:acyl-CoA dehydrogenase family protein n=1 Tax=Streptomyces sp. AM 4-1-1 TaxID=3028710 RepID=UPI0023B9DC84|nr:acyl-CoA dehydrogenase family protein [Streptomyces sp. AM 4-1-1]WEH32444.1 acyl-CoA dehydrogenase family protein [Streptomyces sp. AM 4-1-1]
MSGTTAAPRSDAADLERRFGDPWEPANPVGHAATVAADERDEVVAGAEHLLDEYGLGAEFVPVGLGGRLDRLDRLVEVMRAVFRRDPALGLGYGASSFIAAVNVWSSGSDEQRRRLAGILLRGGRVATVYHELEHGNDLAGAEFTARPQEDGTLRLHGHKELVSNVRRAEALVIFSRTSERPGSRSHSQLLVEKELLPADRYRYRPRFPSVGMRGVQLGGIEFDDCPVGPETVVGRLGQGVESAFRSFQLTRTALPAMATAILDTGLRTTLRFVRSRRLYGQYASDLPLVRQTLAETFTDLLMCDALATTGARAVHLLPGATAMYASAVKFLVAKQLMDAMDRLSVVLGAHFYLRGGEFAIFQKQLRDLQVVGFGHAARIACLATVLPQLPGAARRARGAGAPPELLSRIGAELPPLDFGRLTLGATGPDHLAAVPAQLAEELAGRAEYRGLHRLATVFAAETELVRADALALAPRDLAVGGSADALEVPARYAALLAAACCLNTWRDNRDNGDPFLADPLWAEAALTRLLGRVGRGSGRLPAERAEPMYRALLERDDARRGFDLAGRDLPG